jgi:predicted Zn-dependent protease
MASEHETEAAKCLEQVIAQYPKEPGVHYLNGIHLLARDPDAARNQFEKELQINPSYMAAKLQIAMLDIRASNTQEAVNLAQEVVRVEPRNALARTVLARAYMQQEESAKAAPELEAAAKLAPQNPQIHLYLEQVYNRLGKTGEAQKEKAEFLRLRSAQTSSPDKQ